MAIPNGYVKITPNTLYENVEYYIDTSVSPSSFTSNIEDVPYLNYGSTLEGTIVSIAWDIEPFENFIMLSNSNGTWESSIVNGVHPDYPTLNINITTSPDWLYVKSPAPEYIAEPLYLESELQASKAVEVTRNGSVTVQPDSGFVAVKEVVVTTNVQGGDYVMSEVANATGTTVVFTYAGSGYTVTLTSDSQSTASSSSVAYTYMSTTQPTSASDYDYEVLGNNKLYDNSGSSTALTQPVTFTASELWIWGYGYKINGGDLVYTANTYASATHITLSQNTAIALVNEYYSN